MFIELMIQFYCLDSKEQESTSRILQHQNVTFSKHFLASMTEIVLEKMEGNCIYTLYIDNAIFKTWQRI